MTTRRMYKSGSRWSLWRWTDVVIGGLLYLRRLHLIQTPFGSVMLHWILRPDSQPDLHDHPVSLVSIPLRGWYVEQRPVWDRVFYTRDIVGGYQVERWMCRWWNCLRATDVHRITHVSPGGCLTLVFAGPKVREWGFHTSRGWIPWREYQQ